MGLIVQLYVLPHHEAGGDSYAECVVILQHWSGNGNPKPLEGTKYSIKITGSFMLCKFYHSLIMWLKRDLKCVYACRLSTSGHAPDELAYGVMKDPLQDWTDCSYIMVYGSCTLEQILVLVLGLYLSVTLPYSSAAWAPSLFVILLRLCWETQQAFLPLRIWLCCSNWITCSPWLSCRHCLVLLIVTRTEGKMPDLNNQPGRIRRGLWHLKFKFKRHWKADTGRKIKVLDS